MATDKSEPRSGVILKVGALSIVALVAAHATLVAYFDHIAQAEEHRKFGDVKPEALLNMRADEKERLSSGPMPIDKAMQQIAARGRMGASLDIVPTASRDLAPLQGWSKMPAEVPGAMTAPREATAATAGAPPMVDAGAAAFVDGAAPKALRPDRARPDAGPSLKVPPKRP
jgi:hypothetical protein